MDNAATIIAGADALLLATVDDDNLPHASYVPFAPLNDGLGIAVSGLAAHTAHLRARPRVSALIVAETQPPEGAYARARLTIDFAATFVERDADAGRAIWSALERRHGSVATILRGLPDFAAILLQPLRARLILGFASADDVAAADILNAIRAVHNRGVSGRDVVDRAG